MIASILAQKHDCSAKFVIEASVLVCSRLLIGNIEDVAFDMLSGWIADSENGRSGIPFEVCDRNQIVASGTSDLQRMDLAEAGYKEKAFRLSSSFCNTVVG